MSPANLLIPESVRLRGVNINPGPQHFYDPSVWTGLWKTWDWDTWVRPMIDDALSVGANSVRTVGSVDVVTSGKLSIGEYLARWRQLLDYTAARGMYAMPCGSDLRHWGPATTYQAAEAVYREWAVTLSAYPHVVGVDITNEATAPKEGPTAYMGPDPWTEVIRKLGELVREVAKKPITHSRGMVDRNQWRNGGIYTDMLSDFLSVHCYFTPGRDDPAALRATEWGDGKQILLGEIGADMTLGSAERTERYRAIKALVEGNVNNVGVLAWSGYDLHLGPEDQMGLFDRERRPRTDITSVFSTIPTSR